MLLICGDQDEYDRFREEARAHYGEEHTDAAALRPPPELPALPPLRRPRKLKQPLPLHGVVHFADDWTPTLVRFDPTAERGLTHRVRWRAALRHQVEPLMKHQEERLSGWARVPEEYALRSWRWATLVAGALLPHVTLAFFLIGRITVWEFLVTVGLQMYCGVRSFRTMESVEQAAGLDHVEILSQDDPALSLHLRKSRSGAWRKWTTRQYTRILLIGWFFATVGVVSILYMLRDVFGSRPGQENFLPSLMIQAAPMVWFWIAIRRYSERLMYAENLSEELCVLFLRPFTAASDGAVEQRLLLPVPDGAPTPDRSLEEDLRDVLVKGRRDRLLVTATGPGETARLRGSARLYLPAGNWQTTITEVLPHAHRVVLTADTAPETLWQLTEAVRVLRPEQLLVLVQADCDAFTDFCRTADQALAERLRKPTRPKGRSGRRPRFSLLPPRVLRGGTAYGIIRFTPGWKPHFMSLTSAVGLDNHSYATRLRAVRDQLDPVLHTDRQYSVR
ncbi:hypothetical protein AB0I84_35125 [Streptomyces spectabilis]